MEPITFFKMSGSGNDFIIVDNREKTVKDNDLSGLIQRICRRKISVGADGFILIEPSDKADFKWRFFNSDGSKAEMCGNGIRCFSKYVYENNILKRPSLNGIPTLFFFIINLIHIPMALPDVLTIFVSLFR